MYKMTKPKKNYRQISQEAFEKEIAKYKAIWEIYDKGLYRFRHEYYNLDKDSFFWRSRSFSEVSWAARLQYWAGGDIVAADGSQPGWREQRLEPLHLNSEKIKGDVCLEFRVQDEHIHNRKELKIKIGVCDTKKLPALIAYGIATLDMRHEARIHFLDLGDNQIVDTSQINHGLYFSGLDQNPGYELIQSVNGISYRLYRQILRCLHLKEGTAYGDEPYMPIILLK